MGLHEQAASTKCNICGQLFVGPAFIVGAPATARTVEYVNRLRMHLATDHPNAYTECDLAAAQFLTALVLGQFMTTDGELGRQSDFIRWQVHQKTLIARIPDDKMTTQVDNLAEDLIDVFMKAKSEVDNPDDTMPFWDLVKVSIMEKLMPAFKGVRDVLEEPGKYTVSKIERPTNGRIVTPH